MITKKQYAKKPATVVTGITEKESLKVAIYDGPRVWLEGRIALANMFAWMNTSVTIVRSDDIENGILSDFDLLVMPGGWTPAYQQSLGIDGASKIGDFVRAGGAYVGICAGSFYACDSITWEGNTYMHVQGNPSLFSGYGVEPLEEIPWPEYNMTKINIVKGTNPITDPLPDYEWVLYYGGPEFHPYGEENNIIAIGTYALNGQPAMVAFQCGAGRVFLSGPHPEIEENSTRDGVSWGEAMDDRGSD